MIRAIAHPLPLPLVAGVGGPMPEAGGVRVLLPRVIPAEAGTSGRIRRLPLDGVPAFAGITIAS